MTALSPGNCVGPRSQPRGGPRLQLGWGAVLPALFPLRGGPGAGGRGGAHPGPRAVSRRGRRREVMEWEEGGARGARGEGEGGAAAEGRRRLRRGSRRSGSGRGRGLGGRGAGSRGAPGSSEAEQRRETGGLAAAAGGAVEAAGAEGGGAVGGAGPTQPRPLPTGPRRGTKMAGRAAGTEGPPAAAVAAVAAPGL